MTCFISLLRATFFKGIAQLGRYVEGKEVRINKYTQKKIKELNKQTKKRD